MKAKEKKGSEFYHCGVSRKDITPPVGIRLAGYMVREGLSTAVDEPLTATAIVFQGGDTAMCIIALDLIESSLDYAGRLRKICATAAGIPTASLLINFNHSHSSPCMPGWMPYDTPEQQAMQNEFGEFVIRQCKEAVKEAFTNLQTARIAVGWGECNGNINRRQKTPDGDVLLGEDPDGPCDKSVGVVRVDNLEGKAIAVIFRYSCHTVTLGPRTNIISPDFIGPARALIEGQLGCPSLFLQGCAGNICPITGIGQDTEGREDTERVGQMLGGEVVKICAGLRTHRRRKEPQLVRSVAVFWLFDYESIPPGKPGSIFSREESLRLSLEPFPTVEEVEEEVRDWSGRHEKNLQNGAREADLNVSKRFLYWAQIRLKAAREGPNPLPVEFPVQVIALGNFGIIALPFEVMTETGLSLRADSPFENTFVLGYSNGVVSYLPTPEISVEGGMEARVGYKAFLLPSAIPGDWEPRIKQKALSLAKRVSKSIV